MAERSTVAGVSPPAGRHRASVDGRHSVAARRRAQYRAAVEAELGARVEAELLAPPTELPTPNSPDDRPLGATASRGFAVSTAQTIIVRLLSLAGFTVLARFLTPADYGVAALANVFVALFATLAASGLGATLVQRKDPDRDYIDTTFWLALITGVVLAVVLDALAYPLAAVFHQPLFAPVLLVLSSMFVLIGLTSVPVALLQREFRFGALARATVASNLVATAVGVVFAVLHFGVWALVVQTALAPTVAMFFLWRLCPYRPRWFMSRRDVREIYRVSTQFLGNSIMDFFSQSTDDFLVGARLGSLALGVYSVGGRLIAVMLDVLGNSLTSAALPVFATLQDNRARLRRAYEAAIKLSAFVTMPCFALLLAAAPQLVLVVFGSRWILAVPIVRAFALFGALEAVMLINQVFLQGAGAVRIAFRLSVAGTVLQVIGFLVAVRFGLVWVAGAYVLRAYVLAPVGLWFAGRLIDRSAWASCVSVLRPAIFATVCGVAAYVVGRELHTLPQFVQLVVMVASGVAVYVLCSVLFMMHYVTDIRAAIANVRLRSSDPAAVPTAA